jgi:glycosyltransferase involved in cell wall biosynthesis
VWSSAAAGRIEGVVYNPTYRAAGGRCGQILTVLDLIPLSFPRQRRIMTRYFTSVLPGILERCRGVVVLSRAMRERVREQYGVSAERIHVVPPGVDSAVFRPSTAAAPSQPFLLAAGASLPHKNIEQILDHADLWAGRYRLVVTGTHRSYRRALDAAVRRNKLGGSVTIRTYVDTPALVSLYQTCAAVVYPSLDEGFGLPPLESFACGRPAIVSDIPVHREVCGDAALYVKPGSGEEFRRALEVLDNPEHLRELRARGTRQAALYTWSNTRERLCEALHALTR